MRSGLHGLQRRGRYDVFLKALKTLNYRLTVEPKDDWSEPYIFLESLHLELRFGAVEMLGVQFGVHEERKHVLVKQFLWIGPDEPPELS